MDPLRISLFVIGVVLIALVYAWGRIKRSKDETRYARWADVNEEDTGSAPHVVGRNSGDPETDSNLVDNAYDVGSELPYDDTIDNDESDIDLASVDVEDDWQGEVEASLAEDAWQDDAVPQNDAVDLDSDPESHLDPIDDITSELEALEEIISDDQEPDQMQIGDLDMSVGEPEVTNGKPDKIIVIHVLAREGATFSGPDILSCLMHLGMQYGEMNVFHCLGQNNKSIFSLLNAVEPGVFDLSQMDDMTTPALLLMMSVPNPLPALEAFDGMLEAARSLTASLDGRLCDDRRSVLTRQAIDELRAELASL